MALWKRWRGRIDEHRAGTALAAPAAIGPAKHTIFCEKTVWESAGSHRYGCDEDSHARTGHRNRLPPAACNAAQRFDRGSRDPRQPWEAARGGVASLPAGHRSAEDRGAGRSADT